jgi:hypothetical protein
MERMCAGLLALLLAAPAAWAQCRLSQVEIPVRLVNQRPVGTLTLNGTEVTMLGPVHPRVVGREGPAPGANQGAVRSPH